MPLFGKTLPLFDLKTLNGNFTALDAPALTLLAILFWFWARLECHFSFTSSKWRAMRPQFSRKDYCCLGRLYWKQIYVDRSVLDPMISFRCMYLGYFAAYWEVGRNLVFIIPLDRFW